MSPEQANEVMLKILTHDASEPDPDPNDPDADAPSPLKPQLIKALDVMQQASEKHATTWDRVLACSDSNEDTPRAPTDSR
jgi:hypothetical protein